MTLLVTEGRAGIPGQATRVEKHWAELVEQFQILGGRLDNVRPGYGPRGRGLFAQDAGRPVTIHVPENLLVPDQDVEFCQGVLRIKASSTLGWAEREFFEAYAREISWGGGGREEAERLIQGLQALPERARLLLGNRFGLSPCLRTWSDELAQRQFIESRAIHYQVYQKTVLMPFLELVNHGWSGDYVHHDGIGLTGIFEDEILVPYTQGDAWRFFRSWGFAEPSTEAHSLRTELPGLLVRRRLKSGQALNVKGLGSLWIPSVSYESDVVVLSFATLGNRLAPRTPRAVFRKLMESAGLDSIDETFDRVRRINFLTFLELLGTLDSANGEVAVRLRTAVRYQLQALAECFGSRSLA